MFDWIVVLTPLLGLAVVLLLGFTGCSFEPQAVMDPPPPPPPVMLALTLRARVPVNLTVQGGVIFSWRRPTLVMETATVTVFQAGATDNVFEHVVPTPEAGMWQSRCVMTVEDENANSATGDSDVNDFMVSTAIPSSVAGYQTIGTPSDNDFDVVFTGVGPA